MRQFVVLSAYHDFHHRILIFPFDGNFWPTHFMEIFLQFLWCLQPLPFSFKRTIFQGTLFPEDNNWYLLSILFPYYVYLYLKLILDVFFFKLEHFKFLKVSRSYNYCMSYPHTCAKVSADILKIWKVIALIMIIW